MYSYEHFKNLEELNKKYPKVAKRLLEFTVIPDGEWTEDEIFLYHSPEDFAKYEVEDGWFSNSIAENIRPHLPHLNDHINFTTLAEDFMRSWDETQHYYAEEVGYVLITNNEW